MENNIPAGVPLEEHLHKLPQEINTLPDANTIIYEYKDVIVERKEWTPIIKNPVYVLDEFDPAKVLGRAHVYVDKDMQIRATFTTKIALNGRYPALIGQRVRLGGFKVLALGICKNKNLDHKIKPLEYASRRF